MIKHFTIQTDSMTLPFVRMYGKSQLNTYDLYTKTYAIFKKPAVMTKTVRKTPFHQANTKKFTLVLQVMKMVINLVTKIFVLRICQRRWPKNFQVAVDNM